MRRRVFGIFRPALSMVELAVVMAILGLLVALLSVGVQSARKTARLVHCQNNLRQLGVGSLNFESAHQKLPSNGWGYSWLAIENRVGQSQPGSWLAQVFPFVEGEEDEISVSLNRVSHDDLVESFSKIHTVFQCPERLGTSRVTYRGDVDFRLVGALSGAGCRVDYACNGGAKSYKPMAGPPATYLHRPMDFPWAIQFYDEGASDSSGPNGVAFIFSSVGTSEIQDGLSHTIMAGEKWGQGDWGLGNNQPWTSGDCCDTRRFTDSPPKYYKDPTGNENQFGAYHANVANFVMCDGSIRAVSYAIHPDIFKAMGSSRSQD